MKFDALLSRLGRHGVFDLATLVQLSDERRETLRIQLSRWQKAGKLERLRRGLYAFPPRYGGATVHAAALANRLYAPSYLSGHWALGYYGLIPERVATHTSVTTRGTRSFRNRSGAFTYRHVKTALFFGYRPVTLDGQRVLMAEPEKALLDLWHLERGRWDERRMRAMRFQGFDLVDPDTLKRYAARSGSPRLAAAAAAWAALAEEERRGTVEL
jgi:predicted transcriptional regulator of viral defense system